MRLITSDDDQERIELASVAPLWLVDSALANNHPTNQPPRPLRTRRMRHFHTAAQQSLPKNRLRSQKVPKNRRLAQHQSGKLNRINHRRYHVNHNIPRQGNVNQRRPLSPSPALSTTYRYFRQGQVQAPPGQRRLPSRRHPSIRPPFSGAELRNSCADLGEQSAPTPKASPPRAQHRFPVEMRSPILDQSEDSRRWRVG